MPNPVAVTRNEGVNDETTKKHLYFWCPGCDHLHGIVYWQRNDQVGPVWDWDENKQAPTVSPSILVSGGSDNGTCHSFLRNGKWEFLPDSTHALAGQTVDMVPLPDWMVAE